MTESERKARRTAAYGIPMYQCYASAGTTFGARLTMHIASALPTMHTEQALSTMRTATGHQDRSQATGSATGLR